MAKRAALRVLPFSYDLVPAELLAVFRAVLLSGPHNCPSAASVAYGAAIELTSLDGMTFRDYLLYAAGRSASAFDLDDAYLAACDVVHAQTVIGNYAGAQGPDSLSSSLVLGRANFAPDKCQTQLSKSLWSEVVADLAAAQGSNLDWPKGARLWNTDQPDSTIEAQVLFRQRLSKLGYNWRLLGRWFDAYLEGKANPISAEKFAAIANKPAEFWSVGGARPSNVVMQDIADLVGWHNGANENERTIKKLIFDILREQDQPTTIDTFLTEFEVRQRITTRESLRGRLNELTYNSQIVRVGRGTYALPSVPEDNPYDPSFIPVEPIKPYRDGPSPIVPKDQDYFHTAAHKRNERLTDCIEQEGPAGEQAMKTLAETVPDIADALGSTPADLFMTALVAEKRSLEGLIRAQEAIASLPEDKRDFEALLWPMHVKAAADDLRDILHDLIENDARARKFEDASDEDVPSEADQEFVSSARRAIEALAEQSNLFSPETIDLLKRWLERAEEAVRVGSKPFGRPISALRGILGNLANALARGTQHVWKGGGKFTASAIGTAAVGSAYLVSVQAATQALETIASVAATERLEFVIRLLRMAGGSH